jgi:hypothetical protein
MYILPLTGLAVTFGEEIGAHTTIDMGFGDDPLHTDLDMGFGETSSTPSDSPHTGCGAHLSDSWDEGDSPCGADLSDPWDEYRVAMLIVVQGMMHGKSPGITTHTAAQKCTSTFAI